MPKYQESAVTAKKGINFVRKIVENNGSLFQKIEQENDLGIDAIIEFINNGKPTNISIAVQIKSGISYFKATENLCFIPVNSHSDYWLNHSLPVYGIVYDPEKETGNWINIKTYLQWNKNATNINIYRNFVNIFDNKNYINIFSRLLTKQIPDIDLEFGIQLLESENFEEIDLGLLSLFNNYRNNSKIWNAMISILYNKNFLTIPNRLIYYLAHIPWHPDIFHTGEIINTEIKESVKNMISKFDEIIILKLLNLIDDNGIARGSIGQSIESIISIIHNKKEKLQNIIIDNKNTYDIRWNTACLYAYYEGTNALVFLKQIKDIDGIDIILDNIYEFGGIDFYG